ncbi:hypothetical protein SMG44B_30367 [Stenotrophomonas maltophilia]
MCAISDGPHYSRVLDGTHRETSGLPRDS